MADQATHASTPSSDQNAEGQPILMMRGISKHFGAVRALNNVDFEVYPGEVVALVGDNGAGKSTLVKAISGVGPADEGEAFVNGEPVVINSPQASSRLGIETVYQDLALCDNLDVVANLFLGHELHTGSVLSEVEMERRSLEVLRVLDVKLPSARSIVSTLSGGQRQSIAVAKTILRRARVVLLDEPTAALGVAQTKQVLNLIRRLREQNLGVVVISHNMADVFEVADRIIVMRLGQRVATFNVGEVTNERVIAAITGADFGETVPSNGLPGGK
ncbi:ATP-binding cassette domain-containing protein [Ktedonospora formicarum]|nr:ATP-binding cassette domain-containing protein [Ktedonospora formicarum]